MLRAQLFTTVSLLCLVGAAFALAACAAEAQPGCQIGADCPSGVCNADGTCRDVSAGGSSSSSSTGDTGGTGGSGGSTGGTGGSTGGTGGGKVCAPDHDGSITRAEVPLGPGLHATFKVAQNVTVDTAGKANGDGSRTWDLSTMLTGDHGHLVETLAIDGQWFAPDFVGASYASQLSDSANLLGVFEINDTAVLLRGVVSPTSGATQTKLKFDPAVTVLAFPIQANKTWTTNTAVSGQASGVFGFYNEVYVSKVDAHGDLKTPFGTFPVQRIQIELKRTTGLLVTTTRSFGFVTECFGTVATVTSQTNEAAIEFTNASEVSRFAP